MTIMATKARMLKMAWTTINVSISKLCGNWQKKIWKILVVSGNVFASCQEMPFKFLEFKIRWDDLTYFIFDLQF